ncbi:hypothetical protein [Adhaeribacter soli]|uniref:DUF4377 domain-containing protein n=1 Tax=Adhaeribacter soli TaxID=2607655 RepID=A0A5N1J9P1_9BACT|nr:hypothetical protein [Adhaeribacter soli]KAA9345718.1 hypothetical protein F0P94_01135 [Adhaeribacter soli]
MKKNTLNMAGALRSGVAMLAFLVTASLSGCERGCGDIEPTPDILPCETLVTVESASCASGAFQNQWLKLDNGEWLQPFENQTHITGIQPGQRYRIGYEVMKRDKRYDGQVVCLALPPAGKAIRILCMTPVDDTGAGCDTYVTARKVNCSVGAWQDTWLQLDNGRYLQPWHNGTGVAQLSEGARYKIGYSQMAKDSRYDNVVVCAAMPTDTMAWHPTVVSVNCLEAVTAAGATGK